MVLTSPTHAAMKVFPFSFRNQPDEGYILFETCSNFLEKKIVVFRLNIINPNANTRVTNCLKIKVFIGRHTATLLDT
jgi:hypothetical protein